MAALKASIEFIPQEDWEKTSFGKLLKWVLTVGRWIVIVTELVVVLAFLSRFKFDRELTDLNEKIKQQQAIITASAKFEQEFRLLQKRLLVINELKKTRSEPESLLTELAGLIPPDVLLDEVSVSESQITLSALALSENGLAVFLNNLKNSPKFEKLVIAGASSGLKERAGIGFEIKGEIKL